MDVALKDNQDLKDQITRLSEELRAARNAAAREHELLMAKVEALVHTVEELRERQRRQEERQAERDRERWAPNDE